MSNEFGDRPDGPGFSDTDAQTWTRASDAPALIDLVKAKVKDASGKLEDPADYENAIAEALNRYSKYKPLVLVVDVNGSDSRLYDVPGGWIDEFSMIASIEYPVDASQENLLDLEDYGLYRHPDGLKIRFVDAQPGTGEVFRITFTAIRTADAIPQGDLNAFTNLAASICLEILANAFLQTIDPTIDADSVNYRSKSSEAAARAKQLFKLYKDHIGIKEDDTTPPATAVADMDEKYPGGTDRLTHPRWARERR